MAPLLDPLQHLGHVPYVIEKIFSFVPWPCLDNCRLVCLEWRHYLDSEFLPRTRVRDQLQDQFYGWVWACQDKRSVSRIVDLEQPGKCNKAMQECILDYSYFYYSLKGTQFGIRVPFALSIHRKFILRNRQSPL